MEFGLLDGRDDGQHNVVGLMEIYNTFMTQDDTANGAHHFAEYNRWNRNSIESHFWVIFYRRTLVRQQFSTTAD